MSALLASGAGHRVRWDWRSGCAIHTNTGAAAEVLPILGVHLKPGESVVVRWIPGETAYTVELLRANSLVVA